MERQTFLQTAQEHLKRAGEMDHAHRVNDAALEVQQAITDLSYWYREVIDDNRATENAKQ